ncbi:MAG: hypothetical protein J7518_20755 [Nocardioidaceae bacterium]|nr:hypothetical protein [Nocardioidaceae bacterium]
MQASWRTAVVAVEVALGVLVLTAVLVWPASPTPPTGTRHFQVSSDRWSKTLGACVHLTLEGTLSARARELRLREPSLSALLTVSCGDSAVPVAVGTAADLVQHWSTPGGERISRTSHADLQGRSARFSQSNTGWPARWTVEHPPYDCLSYRAVARISTARASDTFRLGDEDSRVCVTERRVTERRVTERR